MLVGLDSLYGGQLTQTRRRLRDARFAVLTHAAAIERRGRHVLEVLEELGAEPSLIFSPEHGLTGVAQAEEAVTEQADVDAVDGKVPVVSLYGKDKASLSPSQEQLEGLEVLVIDLADVGARYYTYVWTALLAARAAQQAGVHTLILDRPNPLSGDPSTLEGKPQDEGFSSFVGLEPLPIRHAMTVGEIVAHFFARDEHPLGTDGALSIAPVAGWERYRTAEAHARPFVPPSPNMPTLQTALVYPGGCLLEGTNLSEGRGTTLPFQTLGAPFLDGRKLAAALRDAGIPGAMCQNVSFRPSFDKHAGEVCHGVMIHVTNPKLFRPVATYLHVIAAARQQAPEQFEFLSRTYEFESDRMAFDLLTGSSAAREAILADAPVEEVINLVTPVPAEWVEIVAQAEARVQNGARAS